MRLYVSWYPKFSENLQAVQLIANAPGIDGVELYGHCDELKRVKESGLALSVHNPVRPFGVGLQDPEFAKMLSDLEPICAISDAPILGIHILGEPSKKRSEEDATRNCIDNLRLAQQTFTQQVAFETTVYGLPNRPRFCVEPPFIARLLAETGAGFLFDTSHIYISTAVIANETGRPQEELIREIIDATTGHVVQLHFNVPGFKDERWCDMHRIYREKEPISERMLQLAQEVLARNPQLQIITLEMDGAREPVQHAKIMVEQAQIVAQKLGLSTVIRRA